MGKKKEQSNVPKLPEDFLRKLKAVKAKRAKTVIDHILKHGFITTEELSNKYGYDHPPRAARDVREQGIPLETFRIKAANGRSIGAYRFGDPDKVRSGREGGRLAWPKSFKEQILALSGSRCGVCNTTYESRYLQIDHRIPYEVGGDPLGTLEPKDFMLLCGSCNRAKSWSCEHCQNWKHDHLPEVCQICYWANPVNYLHVALRLIRRLDLTWTEAEVSDYDRLVELSKHAETDLPEFVKSVLRQGKQRK